MTINWKWQNLIVAVVSAILGWLSSIAVPPASLGSSTGTVQVREK